MTGVIDVGGGTRGIFGAGVFDFCLDYGISFDYGIGVSAGSANICSFLSAQRGRNLRSYNEYAFRKQYMSMSNYIRKGSYVDLDYIYGTLSESSGEDPFDFNEFFGNPTPMEIVATDSRTGKPVYFDKTDIGYDDFDCVKASCAVPAVCKPYPVYGVPCFDGGISDPIPYKRALEKGCDRLVVILTRPKKQTRDPKKDRLLACLCQRNYPVISRAVLERAEIYNRQLAEILILEGLGKILILAPDDIGELKTLTKEHEPLERLYRKGYKAAQELLPRFLT